MIILAIHSQNVQSSDPTTTSAPPAPDLLPEASQLMSSGDIGAEVAALATTTASDERKAARNEQDNDMKAQEAAEQAEVQDMHDKADLQRIQGFVDGGCQIAQGAMQVGGALASASAAEQRAEASSEQSDVTRNAASFSDHGDALQASVDSLNSGAVGSDRTAAWLNGTGTVFGAGKSVADGLFGGAITDKDAAAKAHEASATAFKQMADDAHDSVQGATDYMNKAVEFYKEYVDTKHQTMMAAIQRA